MAALVLLIIVLLNVYVQQTEQVSIVKGTVIFIHVARHHASTMLIVLVSITIQISSVIVVMIEQDVFVNESWYTNHAHHPLAAMVALVSLLMTHFIVNVLQQLQGSIVN